jgi:CHASE2 domain-containing sensor protein
MKNILRYILHSIGIMLIIVTICAIVNELRYSSSYLDPVGQILGNFTMTDSYFQTENDKSDREADVSSDIIMLDLAQCYSRADIAAGIEYMYNAGAKVIALDVIFSGAGNGDTLANDSLEHVISRCKDHVIAACRMVPQYDPLQKVAAGGDEMNISKFKKEESFFVKNSGCVEACVNVENETIRKFYKTLTFDDTTLSTFVHEIVRMAHPDVYNFWESREENEELIHYKQTTFEKILILEVLDIVKAQKAINAMEFEDPMEKKLLLQEIEGNDTYFRDLIKDKIVLVGDYLDLRDFHDIPINIDGTRRICGTTIHGYAISTLTKPGRLINQMSEKDGLLLGLLYTFLYCFIYCWINEKYNDVSGVLSTTLQIIMMLALVFLGGYLFIERQYNITLLYALLGTGLAGYAAEIFYFLLFKVEKIIVKKRGGKTLEQEIVENIEKR